MTMAMVPVIKIMESKLGGNMIIYQFLCDDGKWLDWDHRTYLLNAPHVVDPKRIRILQLIG